MWLMRSAVKFLRKGKRKLPQRKAKAGEHTEEQAERKEAAPKKKNLAFVIRPQNSRNSSRIQGNRPAQRQARSGQQGTRPGQAAARPARGSRPAGDRPVRPNARHMAHVLRLRTDRLRSRGRQQSVRRRVYARQGRRTHQETDRHRLHVRPRADRPGQQGRPVAEGRPSTERSAQNARPEQGAHGNRQADGRDNRNMSDRPARGERQGGDRRQEETEVRADAASTITETAVRDVRRETDATSAAQVRDRAPTGEIPAGMI